MYSRRWIICIGLGSCIVSLVILFSRRSSSPRALHDWLRQSLLASSFHLQSVLAATDHLRSPYDAPFDVFPSPATLPPRHQRITLIATWNGRGYKHYLGNFIHSAQKNNDSIDLLFVNRRRNPNNRAEDGCIDFGQHGVDIGWDSNTRQLCLSEHEHWDLHTEVLCGRDGWSCTPDERSQIMALLERRGDDLNCDFKPLQGMAFRQHFLHPENPFWAWVDLDMHVGHFAAFPFHLLSRLSFLTFLSFSPDLAFLAGQFTAWNLDDPYLASAWRKTPSLKDATTFLAGKHPSAGLDEALWSAAYLRSDEDGPGSNLSWAVLPGQLGRDGFERSGRMYAISGRTVLILDSSLPVKEVAHFVEIERRMPPRPLVAWKAGRAAEVEEMHLLKGAACGQQWFPAEYAQCIPPHPLAQPHWLKSALDSWHGASFLLASYVRFAWSPPGTVIRRMDVDERAFLFQRKLFVHYQVVKHAAWFQLPDFPVDERHLMLLRPASLSVYAVDGVEGQEPRLRYHRQEDGARSIG